MRHVTHLLTLWYLLYICAPCLVQQCWLVQLMHGHVPVVVRLHSITDALEPMVFYCVFAILEGGYLGPKHLLRVNQIPHLTYRQM